MSFSCYFSDIRINILHVLTQVLFVVHNANIINRKVVSCYFSCG